MANGTVAPNATDSDVGGSESTSKFIAALVVNLVIGLVVLIVFSILRPRKKIIYSPRQLLLDTITPLGKVPQSIIAWVFPAFVVKDDDVFQHAGIDALIHMRFLKLCFKVSLVIMPYGIAVLLPVNYYGGGELGGLDKIAVSNIVLKSPKVWAHVVAAWIYTVVICYLLFAEWKNFILYRQKYLALGKAHQYAVFVRDLPDKLKDQESLKKYVQELFPEKTEDVVIVENLKDLQKLVHQHDTLVWKLDHAYAVYRKTGDRPMHKDKLCCGKKVDSINDFEAQLTALQEKIHEEANKEHQKLSSSFVVFRSLKLAAEAEQVEWDVFPLSIHVTPAPELSSVIWGNLGIGLWQRKVRTLIVYIIVFLLVFFWTIPVAFVSSLVALENLAKIAPFLEPVLTLSAFGKGIIEGFLSGLALMIFFIVLPIIMHLLTNLEGVASKVEEDVSVLGKLFIFVVVNKFLFVATAGSALTKIDEMANSPAKIPAFLAESLPSQSVFFICYIMLVSLTALPLELLRIGPLIVVAIKHKWLCKTKREEEAAWKPPPVAYEKVFANHLFILVVGLSYSVLAPIITPFVAFYFGFGYMVWMHQLMCVYIPVYSRGGLMWPKVFNRIIAGMIVFQLLVLGVLGLKESFIPSAFIIPLPIITVMFFLFIQQYYVRPPSHLSLKMALDVPEASPEFLQEVSQDYARKNIVPDKYELSTASREPEGSPLLEEVTAPDDMESSLPLTKTEASSEPA